MPAIAYYITGHGFGHARRSVEVVKELLRLRGDVTVYFRTAANQVIFQELSRARIRLERVELDPGAIEKDLFTIDEEATVKAVHAVIGNRKHLVASEAAFLRERQIGLILCDIPFLAGDIAAATGIPIIGITNFTWDWIYEPFFNERQDLLREIAKSYGRIPTLLKIPFGGRTDWFKDVIDVPVIASRPGRSAEEILDLLRLDGRRPRVLISLRGGISPEAMVAAARSCPEYVFLSTTPVPAKSPGNLLYFPFKTSEAEVQRKGEGEHEVGPCTFSDLLAASSVVLSKLGYGIVADCLAARVPLLWPRRWGFREDEVTFEEASPYLPMREMAHDDLLRGNWKGHLDRILKMPMPHQNLSTNGASVAAQIISARL